MILLNCGSIRADCVEKRVEFDWEGGVNVHGLVGLGMGEGEVGGVEEVAVELEIRCEAGDEVRGAVEGVANDGMAEGLRVDADLMGAAGFDLDFDEREGAVRAGDALENVNVGDGGAAVGAACGHAGAADEVASDGKGDGGVVLFDVAVDEGQVGLRNLALGEHLAELAVGAVVFGDEDEAAGLLVEAMDDAGAEVAADVGEFMEVEEEGVDEGALVAGVVCAAGSGVNHHACRFVDDGEGLVFVEDVEGDVFGDGVEGFGLGRAFDLDGFAAVEFLFGFGWVAVDADLTGFDEELDSGAGEVGEGLSEVLVEAEIGGGGVGFEGADAGVVRGVGVFFEFVEVDDGDGRWDGFFDATGGAVLGFYGAAALALGEHVLRRHG
jgi:hypothetical protein